MQCLHHLHAEQQSAMQHLQQAEQSLQAGMDQACPGLLLHLPVCCCHPLQNHNNV